MKIEVKKLISRGEYNGDFSYEVEAGEEACIIPLCKIAGKVRVSGDFEIFDDDSVRVNLKLSYRLEGQCSYCLEPAAKDVEYESEIYFVPERDSDDYVYDGINIDLSVAVNDAILFSQPQVLLCREGCTGIDFKNK